MSETSRQTAKEAAENSYLRAKQFFDFCQWLVLCAVFFGVFKYFLKLANPSFSYIICMTAATGVTIFGFYFTLKNLHAQLSAAFTFACDKCGLALLPKKRKLFFIITLFADLFVIYAMMHMMDVLASNTLSQIESRL